MATTNVFVFAAISPPRPQGRGREFAAQRAAGRSANGGMDATDTTKDEPERGIEKTCKSSAFSVGLFIILTCSFFDL
jgi:hypothetical protein